MKKTFIFSCMMSLAWLTSSADTVLWEGEKVTNWGYDAELAFSASTFANTQTGDILVISVTPTAGWGCAIIMADQANTVKYYYNSDDSNGLFGKTINPGKNPTDYQLSISEEFLAQLKENGLSIWGGACTLTKIVLADKPVSVNADTQNPEKSVNWWNNNLPASVFTCATAGDMLTVAVTAIKDGETAYVLVRSTEGEGQNLQSQSPESPGVVKFVMDQEMVDAAKIGKLQVQGANYSYTSIDLFYAPTVNISAAAEYATFSFKEKLDLTGIEAYAVSEVGEKATLASLTDKKIAANTGIILYKGGGGFVRIPFTAEDTDNITNSLTGTADGPVTATGSQLVLADSAKGVGFYKIKSGDTIAQNTAYLTVTNGAADFIGLPGSEANDIDNVSSKTDVRGDFFDLQGRKVFNPSKGIYFVNGKKVIK